MNRFIKFLPSNEFFDLIKLRPTAFTLLSLIVARARRTPNKINGLQAGEAYIGDYQNYGATEQIYRTDKKFLKSTGWVTFKSTNKGTVAKVVNTDIFDINLTDRNEQTNGVSNGQLTDSQRLTKNDKNVKKDTQVKENNILSLNKNEAIYLNRLNLYDMAWKYKLPVEKVLSKYREVLSPDNREKYKIKSTSKTLHQWIKRSISKGEMLPLTEFEHLEMLKHSAPEKEDEEILVYEK